MKHNIQVGMVKEVRTSTFVSEGTHTVGADELHYLVSAPMIISMVVDISSKMLETHLSPGYITIGTKFELNHEKPTLTGEPVNMKVVVTNVEGNHIFLTFEGVDSAGKFCKGYMERYVVDTARLMHAAYERFPTVKNQP